MTAPTSPGVVPADDVRELVERAYCAASPYRIKPAAVFNMREGDRYITSRISSAWHGWQLARANRPSLTEDERDVSPPDDVTETEVRERAWKVIRDCGWTNGNRVGLHSVVELMVRLGMDLTRNPAADRCIYPDCGCDFDAVCETGRLRTLADRSEPRQEKEGDRG